VQYRTSPSGTWTDACTDATAPWAACSWATATVPDGLYDLRAVTTDAAGNSAASATISSRRVDNVGPTVSLTDPGVYLAGVVTLAATATDPVGVASVSFERRATTGSTWNSICTDATAPYACAWTTTGVADGLWDLRATSTDTLGHVSSSLIPSRTVDNTKPAPVDVQAGNGGAVAGKPEAGDWIAFTWSEPVKPALVLAGWTGATTSISVTFVDTAKKDTLALEDTTATTALNIASSRTDVALASDVVSADTTFDATMVQNGATITVTLGAKRGTNAVKIATAAAMTWKVSNATTDLAGNAIVTGASVTESGAADTDF
jgi:chitinase